MYTIQVTSKEIRSLVKNKLLFEVIAYRGEDIVIIEMSSIMHAGLIELVRMGVP
ncbi:MAG: hypothetical protein QG591_95, partial [Planctomycetota bacterium]|nr:hypothetical protein [Planctomycetota bacterium]